MKEGLRMLMLFFECCRMPMLAVYAWRGRLYALFDVHVPTRGVERSRMAGFRSACLA